MGRDFRWLPVLFAGIAAVLGQWVPGPVPVGSKTRLAAKFGEVEPDWYLAWTDGLYRHDWVLSLGGHFITLDRAGAVQTAAERGYWLVVALAGAALAVYVVGDRLPARLVLAHSAVFVAVNWLLWALLAERSWPALTWWVLIGLGVGFTAVGLRRGLLGWWPHALVFGGGLALGMFGLLDGPEVTPLGIVVLALAGRRPA